MTPAVDARSPVPAVRPEVEDISLGELLTPVRRRWKFIAATGLAAAVLAAIYLLLVPPVFTARTTFTPETPSQSSMAGLAGLAGLAGQLGIGSALGSGGLSQDFLADVLHSREVMRALLTTKFEEPGTDRPRELLDILRIAGDSREDRLQIGTERLRALTKTEIDRRTGVIALSVDMADGRLAAQVANRLVGLLNEFNLERRQSQSRAQRRFTGEQLQIAEQELRDAERRQLAFLSANRAYSESPMLAAEAGRLERTVRVKQEVFLTLTKGYQEARIAEVRDTPVLTVVDTAIAPLRRSRPRRAVGTLVALALGLLVGACAAYVLEYRRGHGPGRRALAIGEASGGA